MFVVHGHITLNGKKINSPSYVVLKGQEDEIGFYPSSPVAKQIEEYNKNKNEKANICPLPIYFWYLCSREKR